MTDEHHVSRTHCENCGDELRHIRKNTDWAHCMECSGHV